MHNCICSFLLYSLYIAAALLHMNVIAYIILSWICGLHCVDIALYDPDKEFRCFDGSQTIPFAHINDDYCDCVDGSDEPGMQTDYNTNLCVFFAKQEWENFCINRGPLCGAHHVCAYRQRWSAVTVNPLMKSGSRVLVWRRYHQSHGSKQIVQ